MPCKAALHQTTETMLLLVRVLMLRQQRGHISTRTKSDMLHLSTTQMAPPYGTPVAPVHSSGGTTNRWHDATATLP